MLSILSGFTFNIMASGILFFIIGLLPLAFIIAFSGLEIAISFIQAQVFVVLTSSYIKDALCLHGDGPSKKKGGEGNPQNPRGAGGAPEKMKFLQIQTTFIKEKPD
jgi:hypothetical protein